MTQMRIFLGEPKATTNPQVTALRVSTFRSDGGDTVVKDIAKVGAQLELNNPAIPG